MKALAAVLLAAVLLAGCGGDTNSTTTDNSQTTTTTDNSVGIAIPSNAVEIVDGIWIYQDGDGNYLQLDATTGETTPQSVGIVQRGSNNAVVVSVAPYVPPVEPAAE